MQSAPEIPAEIRPRHRLILLVVLGVALALRIGILLLQAENLQRDVDAYLSIAERLIAGDGFAGPGGDPTAYRPPLYPLLLAAVLALGGGTTIGLVQVVLGTLTVWLTYEIGRRCVPGRGALLAAAIVAVDPLLVEYTVFTMTEVLCGFLIALLFGLGYSRIEPRWRNPLVGVVFGLAALARPTMWSFGVLAALWWLAVYVVKRRTSPGTTRAGVVREIPWAVVAGIAVVVAPWGARNLLVFGRPILTTTHGGYTLLLGNNPVFYREVVAAPWGTTWSHEGQEAWQASLDRQMTANDPPIATEVQRDAWMYEQARRNIAAEPGLFVRSCWLRLRRFWNVTPLEAATEPIREAWVQLCGRIGPQEWCGNAADRIVVAVRWGVGSFYVLVTAGMLVGLVRLRRAEWRRWMPLVLLIASFSLVHLCYWSNTRMRAPLVPAIALLAARGVAGGRSFHLDGAAQRGEAG